MSVARYFTDVAHTDFLGHPPRWNIPDSNDTDQARQQQLPKSVVTNRHSCLSRIALIPVVTSEIIAEFVNHMPIHLHQFQTTIPDQKSVALEDHRKQTVAM